MMFDQPPGNPIAGPSGSGMMSREQGSSSRKRSIDNESMEVKRPKYNYCYVKLASESSSELSASEDGTESVHSIQGYETEWVQDTPDTDTKSEYSSSSDVEFEIEYELDDPSGQEETPFVEGGSSSSGTEDVLAAAGAIAAVICDSSKEAWLTDGEDSDNSSAGDSEVNSTGFRTCVQCKSQNENPLYRFCQKCFQMRREFFPPRPRGHRKRQETDKQSKKITMSVQRDMPGCSTDFGNVSQETPVSSQETSIDWQDSVNGSHDSGIGSLEFDVGLSKDVPTYTVNIASTSKGIDDARGVKRKSEEGHSAVDGNDLAKRTRIDNNPNEMKNETKPLGTNGLVKIDSNDTESKSKELNESDINKTSVKPEVKCNGGVKEETEFVKPHSIVKSKPLELKQCIMCVHEPPNSVFVHTQRGCVCCCYKCAMRTWATLKKCPACTRKVKTIIRINMS